MTTLKEKVDELQRQNQLKKANTTAKSKVTGLFKEQHLDLDTGEVNTTEIKQTFVTKGQEPRFVKVYLDDLLLLKDLPTKSSAILWELIKNTTYENKIILNGSIKKEIISRLDIKISTLNNALSRFTKAEILYRLDTGIYMPNPYLFARGKWEDVQDLRMIVDYKSGKREIQIEINGESALEYNQNKEGAK